MRRHWKSSRRAGGRSLSSTSMTGVMMVGDQPKQRSGRLEELGAGETPLILPAPDFTVAAEEG